MKPKGRSVILFVLYVERQIVYSKHSTEKAHSLYSQKQLFKSKFISCDKFYLRGRFVSSSGLEYCCFLLGGVWRADKSTQHMCKV